MTNLTPFAERLFKEIQANANDNLRLDLQDFALSVQLRKVHSPPALPQWETRIVDKSLNSSATLEGWDG